MKQIAIIVLALSLANPAFANSAREDTQVKVKTAVEAIQKNTDEINNSLPRLATEKTVQEIHEAVTSVAKGQDALAKETTLVGVKSAIEANNPAALTAAVAALTQQIATLQIKLNDVILQSKVYHKFLVGQELEIILRSKNIQNCGNASECKKRAEDVCLALNGNSEPVGYAPLAHSGPIPLHYVSCLVRL